MLHKQKFSVQANRKTREGDRHPDRDAQFVHTNTSVNEAGKSDHRNRDNKEETYAFTTFRQILADFLAYVRRLRGGKL